MKKILVLLMTTVMLFGMFATVNASEKEMTDTINDGCIVSYDNARRKCHEYMDILVYVYIDEVPEGGYIDGDGEVYQKGDVFWYINEDVCIPSSYELIHGEKEMEIQAREIYEELGCKIHYEIHIMYH